MADYITTEGAGQAESLFVTIAEAAEIIGCSYTSAQKAVATCNKRAKELGLFVCFHCLRFVLRFLQPGNKFCSKLSKTCCSVFIWALLSIRKNKTDSRKPTRENMLARVGLEAFGEQMISSDNVHYRN